MNIVKLACTRRAAFTLFELILAVALSAVLLSLIGMAINLYLKRVDADRGRVEEAQLARSVLNMITDDIRAATIYKPQDTSTIAQLMAANTPFNVDSIDKARQTGASGGGPGAPGGANSVAALAASMTGAAGSASGASTPGSNSSSASASTSGESEETLPLGLSGSDQELYVDVARLPYQDELFGTVTGFTNAPSAASSNAGGVAASMSMSEVNPPADVKTVHYFVRTSTLTNTPDTTGNELSPTAQLDAPGLVRQEVGRPARVFAEQAGNTDELNSGEVLVAPEVVQLQFRYFDGTQLLEDWDIKELQKLPTAIEVTIWLRSTPTSSSMREDESPVDLLEQSRSYRQVVYLPMATQSATGSEASATSSTSGMSSTSTSQDTGAASTSDNSSPDSVFQ